MKKAIIPWVLALAITAAGCSAGASANQQNEVDEKTVPVETLQISNGTISRELIYAGQVKPIEQITVAPKVGGKVINVNYDVGDSVDKDAVLFEIDDTDVQSAVAAAQAQYNASLAGVDSARSSYSTVVGSQSESTVMQLESAVNNAELAIENTLVAIDNANIQVENAQLALNTATTNYNNAKVLYEAGTMSKSDFDKVEYAFNQALAGLEQANNMVTQAQVGYNQAVTGKNQAQDAYNLYVNKTKGSTASQAQSGVNQASSAASATKVQLDNALRSLDDLKVKSPITGTITARNVTEGAMASPSLPAYTVIDMSKIEISTNISEELINILMPGMSVPVYISTVREEPFDGTITTISPQADEIKNTYPVKVVIDNPDGLLKPGMFAEVYFTKEISYDTIVLPRNTVMDEETSKYVFCEENGVAVKYVVETGIDNGKEIEIISGLPANARVIVKGQTHAAEGDKVKVVGVAEEEGN